MCPSAGCSLPPCILMLAAPSRHVSWCWLFPPAMCLSVGCSVPPCVLELAAPSRLCLSAGYSLRPRVSVLAIPFGHVSLCWLFPSAMCLSAGYSLPAVSPCWLFPSAMYLCAGYSFPAFISVLAAQWSQADSTDLRGDVRSHGFARQSIYSITLRQGLNDKA